MIMSMFSLLSCWRTESILCADFGRLWVYMLADCPWFFASLSERSAPR